jgi:hypothetical protein
MPRLARLDAPGVIHHVIIRGETFEKLPIVSFRPKGEILNRLKPLRFLVAIAPRNDKIQRSRGIERREIFRDDKDRNDMVDRLSALLPATNTSCYAWAFLTNHLHFLFRSGNQGLSTLMRRLLTGYAIGFNHEPTRDRICSEKRGENC